jgi:hypothetical protein
VRLEESHSAEGSLQETFWNLHARIPEAEKGLKKLTVEAGSRERRAVFRK